MSKRRSIVTALLLGATFTGLGFGSAAQASENFGLPKDVSKIQQKDFRIRHLRTQAPQKLVVNNDVKTTSSSGKINVRGSVTGSSTGTTDSSGKILRHSEGGARGISKFYPQNDEKTTRLRRSISFRLQ